MERARVRSKVANGIAASLAAGLVFAAGGALACGYHNPSDVARGTMNFIYPKSLYVRTAVWQAQSSGLLPPRSARAAKDLFAYQRIAASLRTLGNAVVSSDARPPAFTVVLLDTMLWTRYAGGENGFDVEVHVKGPEKGDAVLVTESEVVRALNAGTLSFDRAEANGLIRLYGPADRQDAVRVLFRAPPAGTRADRPRGAEGAPG